MISTEVRFIFLRDVHDLSEMKCLSKTMYLTHQKRKVFTMLFVSVSKDDRDVQRRMNVFLISCSGYCMSEERLTVQAFLLE